MNEWVMVSGGSRGIGAGIVRNLAEAGYRVAFSYKSQHERAERLIEDLTTQGHIVRALCLDSRRLDEHAVDLEALFLDWGDPYALINCQGITRDASVMTMSWDDWRDVIDTNLNGTFAMIKAFLPHMLERGGCIIQISSIAANKGVAGQCNYATTKAGLLGLTRSLAVELSRFNIRVNAICPGFIDTDMLSPLEARKANIVRGIPLKRIGHPEDIAQSVRFLLSRGASYITGQTITIDGGITS